MNSPVIPNTVVAIYVFILAVLSAYIFQASVLIILYLWHRRDPLPPLPEIPDEELPIVTIQVPLRNELGVARRILKNIASLDWPRDRLDIQILDDSDDETAEIVNQETRRMIALGFSVCLIRRQSPAGFKAGALAEAMPRSRGNYMAIFDADFCPPHDFLRRTVPHLIANKQLGIVQTRWGHLNAEYSAITRIQALFLDAIIIDQIARCRSGLLLNFNGSAGVWRRAAIESAGGWQSDTVSEDMDLSYRAQLAGWKILYLPDIVVPAEIPPLMTTFKQQQYRWAKGTAQCVRKLIGPILRTSRLRWSQKVMALLHLTAYLPQTLFLFLILLSMPMAIYAPALPPIAVTLGTLSAVLPTFYMLSQVAHYRDWPRRVLYYPGLLLLGMGLAWNTTLALIDGLLHWGGDFVRTPKFQIKGTYGEWRNNRYLKQTNQSFVGEICMALYAGLTVWLAYNIHSKMFNSLSLAYIGGAAFVILEQMRLKWFTTKNEAS
ncbi:MAG: glycosyltransferase [Anaerolineae bacterium]|nr:glycosyltransferase [Anaerolineae bacterium]